MFTTYKIKKYFIKNTYSKGYVVCAKIFKYRFGFLVDIYKEELDNHLRARHELKPYEPFIIQFPKLKKEAILEKNLMSKRLN